MPAFLLPGFISDQSSATLWPVVGVGEDWEEVLVYLGQAQSPQRSGDDGLRKEGKQSDWRWGWLAVSPRWSVQRRFCCPKDYFWTSLQVNCEDEEIGEHWDQSWSTARLQLPVTGLMGIKHLITLLNKHQHHHSLLPSVEFNNEWLSNWEKITFSGQIFYLVFQHQLYFGSPQIYLLHFELLLSIIELMCQWLIVDFDKWLFNNK